MRKFSQDNSHLFVYNLKRQQAYSGTIKNLCQSKYFYGNDLKLETFLNQIETKQSPILKQIIGKQDLDFLTRDTFYYLRLFILLQYSRTKDERNVANKMFEEFCSKYLKPLMKSDEELKRKGYTSSQIDNLKIVCSDFYKVSMEAAFEKVDSIIDLEYVLLINKTSKNFIFSDAPVVFYNYKRIKNRSTTGCKSRGLQIFLPLSKNIMLILIDNNMYNIKKDAHTTIFVTKEEDIDSLNTLQFYNCLENVFFSEELDKKYVETLYSQNKNEIEKREAIIETVSSKELPNNRRSDIDVLYRADISYKLKLSFIKLNKQSSMSYKRSIKRHLKKHPNFVLVRNENINETIRKIIDRNEGIGLF